MGTAEAGAVGAAETEAAEMLESAGCPTGGVANSFAPDTWVMAQTGLVPIADIHVGDLVFAYNQALHTNGFYTVTATLVHVDPVELVLTLDNERIETTPGHPFFTANGEWVAAGDLKIGDSVRRADGSIGMVRAIVTLHDPEEMYNLTVAVAHTFFVGDEQWLVHNACGPTLSYQSKYDKSGRLKSVNATLDPDAVGTGTTQEAREFVRSLGKNTDDAGHAIGRQLGGLGGRTSGNVFPQAPNINRGAYRDFENMLREKLDGGANINVKVKFDYKGASTRPYKVVYKAEINGKVVRRVFANK